MRSAERDESKKPAMREKLHITRACAALMAYLAILWLGGDAGTAQQTKHGGLYEPWWGSATTGVLAMVEDEQLDNLDMDYQGWDPGEMYTTREGPTVKQMQQSKGLHSVYEFEGMIWVYMTTGIVMEWDPGEMNSDGEMYLPEGSMANEVIRGHVITGIVIEWDPGEINTDSEMYLQEVSMAKGVIRGHVITGIVLKWDNKKQCHERAMMSDLSKEDEVPGIRWLYEINKVVWDTGQQAHMGKIARVEQGMVGQSASFGWCTNVRGTDAEVDITNLETYSSQEMVGHRRQYKLEHRAGQRFHHHQWGGHGGLHQQEARYGHLQQQGEHNPLPRPADHQPEQEAGHDRYQGHHPLLGQAGRPHEEGSGCDGGAYDDINLELSCRNKC